jgi:uncharacterized membrane protein YGL010W
MELDPNVAFLIFSVLIPFVMLGLKIVFEKFGVVMSELAKQALAAAVSLLAVGLQVYFVGGLPAFEGTQYEVLKTLVTFFAAQMALYEVVFKRVWAAFGL